MKRRSVNIFISILSSEHKPHQNKQVNGTVAKEGSIVLQIVLFSTGKNVGLLYFFLKSGSVKSNN